MSCATCELHAEAVFRVEGMDCNEEVVILERRLKPLTGWRRCRPTSIGQRLHVKYDAAKLTTAAMVDAVGQTGMRMWLEHEEPRASAPTSRARCWLTVGVGVALVAGAGRLGARAAARGRRSVLVVRRAGRRHLPGAARGDRRFAVAHASTSTC